MAKKSQEKKEERYIMICPKCKSPDIDMDKSNPAQPALGLPPMYICNKCKHSGYTFPEVLLSKLEGFETEAKKEGLIDSTADKTPKVDTRYGSFLAKIIWKITGPLMLLIGLLFLLNEPIVGVIALLAGIFMIYVAYFKKKELKEN